MLKNKKLIIALLLIPAIIGVKVAAYFPEFIEGIYSTGLYPFISRFFRYFLGWIPFSFGDLVYGFGIIFIIRWLILSRKRVISDLKNWLIDVFAAVSIIYISFHLFWGLNYYRLPLHKNLNLEANYTTEALVEVTKKLIHKTNTLHLELTNNDSVIAVSPYSKATILKMVPEGYSLLKEKYPHLEYKGESIKTSLFSLPLTYMGFSGYLNPLTNEAQVDGLIPEFKFPTTASHEIGHQLGYAAENEANFMACLATTTHSDLYFRYCGYAFGLRHCLHEIYRRDPALYNKLVLTLNTGVLKNYQEVRDFWDAHKNPTEPLFRKTYNTYLEANNQQGGMDSYSYVVALLVNYFEDKTL